MTFYLVKPNNATDPFDAFLVEVSGYGVAASVSIYERSSCPWGEDYTIDSPAERDDFARDVTVEIYRKWDGCTEIRIDEHWCDNIAAIADKLALFIKAGTYLGDTVLDCDATPEENPGVNVEEFDVDFEREVEYVTWEPRPELAALAEHFDNVVLGISTAGGETISTYSPLSYNEKKAKPAPSFVLGVLDETTGEFSRRIIPLNQPKDKKQELKAKRKEQRQGRKNSRKKK